MAGIHFLRIADSSTVLPSQLNEYRRVTYADSQFLRNLDDGVVTFAIITIEPFDFIGAVVKENAGTHTAADGNSTIIMFVST